MIKYIFLVISTSTYFAMAGQEVKETILTNNPSEDRYASYSPNGKHIIFESDRNGNWEIYRMDVNGQNQEQISFHESDDRQPAWHPDGDKIVFQSNRGGKFELYEFCLEKRSTKKLPTPDIKGEAIFAGYSPDGNSIAFSHRKSTDEAEIVLMTTEGRLIKRLGDNGFRSFYPRWSPDGAHILFFSRHQTDNQDDEIYLVNKDGTGERRLTNWPTHNFCPDWSPDGSKIAYVTSMADSRPEIYVMNADGTNKLRITHNEDGDTLPSWSPDGEKLLITGYRNGNYEILEIALVKE